MLHMTVVVVVVLLVGSVMASHYLKHGPDDWVAGVMQDTSGKRRWMRIGCCPVVVGH